jgi:putative transposase
MNIHAVFAVRGRQNLLAPEWRNRLFEYVGGTVRSLGGYPLMVNGYSDHIHVFFELPPTLSASKFIQQVKANSSRWINDRKLVKGKFEWQAGYGAFSNSRSQRSRVIRYIQNQENHHAAKNFRREYIDFLKNNEIVFDEKYLFEFYD